MTTSEAIAQMRELRFKAMENVQDHMDEWIWDERDETADLGEGSHWRGLVDSTIDGWYGPGEYVIGVRIADTFLTVHPTCQTPEDLAESIYKALTALHHMTGEDVDAEENVSFTHKLGQ